MDSYYFWERPWGSWEESYMLSPLARPHKLILEPKENDFQGF